MASALPYPALHATHAGIWLAHGDGRVEAVGRGAAIARAAETPLILLNAPLVGSRLGYPELNGLDLLELFAFVHPARFAVPTPKGMADALGLAAPADDAAAASFLRDAAAKLLATLETDWPEREGAWASAQALHRLRWPWAAAVWPRLARPERDERWLFSRLPEWEESNARGQPRSIRIEDEAALEPAGRPGRRECRAARGPARSRRQRLPGLRAAPRSRPAEPAARRGRHRDRQDARLSRPRLALGGGGERRGLGLDLHQGAAAPARPRGRAALSRPRGAQAAHRDPQGPRELSLPAQSGGCAAGRLRRPCRDPRPARRPLGRLHEGRRHGRRRPARLADRLCSAAPARPRSPTGAANASMPAARITGNASSSARPARAATPTSSSPTTR